jgi:Kef-type K+ transport system membrane component KefB
LANELIGLGILFFMALIGGTIASKLKQPAVFGLLLVGAIIGPNFLNLVQDMNMIKLMAEFGAILILFIVGLEFDISKLMKLGIRTALIGIFKFSIILFVGYNITILMGFSAQVGLFVGILLSFSSTVVIVKVLEQKEMYKRREVPFLIAVLIIEDVIAVLVLTFFSGINNSAVSIISTFEKILFSIGILTVAYFIMLKVLRHGVNLILRNNNDESVLTFLSLGMGALFSYFAYYLGLAPSAGAFLAGSLIASLPNSHEYGKAVHPYAMIFTSVFFIAMGTLVNFKSIQPNIVFIGILVIAVIITRLIAIGLTTYIFANYRHEQPFFASITMMAMGEFSLLVAKEGEKFGLGVDLVTITASLIFITAILTSLSVNKSEKIYSFFKSLTPVRTRIKLQKFSDYFRRLFDQMEIEYRFTHKLKTKSKTAAMLILLTIFLMFIVRKISILASLRYGDLVLYSFYFISALAFAYITLQIYKKIKVINHTLSSILTRVDSSRSLPKCYEIVKSLAFSFILLMAALLFPFVIFMLELSMIYNIIPLLLLFGAAYFLKRFSQLTDNHSHFAPKFKPNLAFAKF